MWALLSVGGKNPHPLRATMYLIVFNRPRRQGVHDLVVGSFVADADMSGPLKLEPTWEMHWVILAALAILVLSSERLIDNRVSEWEVMPRMLEDVRLVENMPECREPGFKTWVGQTTVELRKEFLS